MASVSIDDVRDVINVTSAEVPDHKVLKMVKRAEITLELETNREIDSGSCTDAEGRVEFASLEKLAKMLRILGFLTQTKVYLFWKKHQS